MPRTVGSGVLAKTLRVGIQAPGYDQEDKEDIYKFMEKVKIDIKQDTKNKVKDNVSKGTYKIDVADVEKTVDALLEVIPAMLLKEEGDTSTMSDNALVVFKKKIEKTLTQETAM